MNTPNLCDDCDLLDVIERQFRDKLEMADAACRSEIARGIRPGLAYSRRARAVRAACEWRDQRGLPAAHTESSSLPPADAYGAAAHIHNRPHTGQNGD